MKWSRYLYKLKYRVTRSKYLLHAVLLTVPLVAPLAIVVPTASASPTFNSYSITSSYSIPGSMTSAGGALWYVERLGSATDYIGKITTTGSITDYNIGLPSGAASFQIAHIAAGPDGNVWFDGNYSNGVYIGYLDISTGAVTFYGSPVSSYGAGLIATGSDGKVYYVLKNANNSRTDLLSIDPTTGTSTTVYEYDTYTVATGLASGPDGRMWVSDSYYDRIYAVTLSSGSMDTYSDTIHSGPAGIIAGPDGNMWFVEGTAGNITKLTTSGTFTQYPLSSGVSAQTLVAGPDNAVWFIDAGSIPKIGRVTTSGTVTEYAIPGGGGGFQGAVLGPDNAVWYDYQNSGTGTIGRATTEPFFSNYSITTSYRSPGSMTTAGGAVWYVEGTSSAPNDFIGKMTPSGTITDYSIGNPPRVSSGFQLAHITTGSDGNVWFDGVYSSSLYVGYLDISTGAVTFYGSPIGGYTAGLIATGSDGNVYFAVKSANDSRTYLEYINPTTGTVTNRYTYDTYTNLTGLANGTDGRMWATDSYYDRIYALSVSGGTDDTYSAALHTVPKGIIAGPDGNMWFIGAAVNNITKLTTSGTFTQYSLGSGVSAQSLVAGSDGNIWFISSASGIPAKIDSMTTSGSITEYPTGTSLPGTAVLGADNAIWFDYGSGTAGKIGRLGH